MTHVDAVLITYNTGDPLVEALQTALNQTRPPRTVLIIDNNPLPVARNAVDGLESKFPATRIEVAHYPDNLGPAGGFNEGCRILGDMYDDLDWILLLDDDDPLPSLDVVERLLIEADSLPRDFLGGIGLMGGLFEPSLLLAKPVPLDGGRVAEVDYLFGWASLLYSADALQKAGCCRPELFYRYVDLDQGLRLRRAGWALYAAVGVLKDVMGERQHPKMAERPGTPRTYLQEPTAFRYYRLRNLVNIGMHYCRRRDVLRAVLVRAVLKPLASLPLMPRLSVRVLALNMRAVADGVTGRLGRNHDLEERLASKP